jgi:hypothetical protein
MQRCVFLHVICSAVYLYFYKQGLLESDSNPSSLCLNRRIYFDLLKASLCFCLKNFADVRENIEICIRSILASFPWTVRPLSWFKIQFILAHLFCSIHVTFFGHLILLDLKTQIIFGDEYKS